MGNQAKPQTIESIVNAICKDGVEANIHVSMIIKKESEMDIPKQAFIAKAREEVLSFVANKNYTDVLTGVKDLSKAITDAKITYDTPYKLLFVSVTDISIGRDVGAELTIDQAEARKFLAVADAEQRRTDAVAAAAEMKALALEMVARVISAKADLIKTVTDKINNQKKVNAKEISKIIETVDKKISSEDLETIKTFGNQKEQLKSF